MKRSLFALIGLYALCCGPPLISAGQNGNPVVTHLQTRLQTSAITVPIESASSTEGYYAMVLYLNAPARLVRIETDNPDGVYFA